MQIIWWPRLLKRASSPVLAKTLSSAVHKAAILNSRFAKPPLTLISRSCFLAQWCGYNTRRNHARPRHGCRGGAGNQCNGGAEDNEEGANPNPSHQRIYEDLDDRLV